MKFNIRTDMAVESAEILLNSEKEKKSPDGIGIEVEETENTKITVVKVKNKTGEEKIGKPAGTYITLESKTLRENDVAAHEKIISLLSEKLGSLEKLGKDSPVLIVGLGNWNVTPDALGPRVVSKVLVTRHIMDTLPDRIKGSTRPVSAITPGVMGITGIETCDIVRGITEKAAPGLVIAIDALAARSSHRINSAIQISDTGISPGSGMGNARKGLNEKTLGVPVIGIGVPTVIDAATLVNDTLDRILDEMIGELPEGSPFLGMLNSLESEEKYALIRELLDPHTENMFVAPKEVDAVIERLSNIIANAVNIALHPGIGLKDINRYIY